MSQNLSDFLAFRKNVSHRLAVEFAFIDMCAGDHLAALVLSQLLDALALSGESTNELVWRDGRWMLSRSWDGWFRRTRVRRKQGHRVLRLLRRLGYVQTATCMRGGTRVLHIALIEARFLEAWAGVLRGIPPVFFEGDDGE